MIVQRSFGRTETNPGYPGAFYVTDISGPAFPSWVPQKFYITRARLGHQNPASTSSGQFVVGVDHDRMCVKTGTNPPYYQIGDDVSRWTTLASLWLNERQDICETLSPPVAFDRSRDSLHINFGPSNEIYFWQIGIQYDDTQAEWPGYAPNSIVRCGEYHDTAGTGWAGYGIRMLVPASVLPSTSSKLQIALQGGTEPVAIAGAFIGPRAVSGNAWDFASAPTRLTLSGANSYNVPANSRQPLDEISYAYAGGDLILSLAVADNGATNAIPSKIGSAWCERWIKASGAADVSTLSPSGFDAGAANNIGLSWVATG